MAAVATVTDLEAALRRGLSEDEARYAPALLSRAETLIRVRYRALDELVADPLLLELVRGIEAEAVARVLRADNGGIYRTETEDAYSYTLNYQVASGLLDILEKEWDALARATGGRGVRTVAPVTDGYAAARYGCRCGGACTGGCRPDLDFQYRFPAYDSFTTRPPGGAW